MKNNTSLKTCSKCGNSKDIDDFSFKNKKRNIRSSWCLECSRVAIKRHYTNNKAYYINKAKLRNKRNRILIREYILNHLIAHPCVDCGESDIRTLEFDHVRGIKLFDISLGLGGAMKLEMVVEEIEKCEVRCANHHSIATAERANSWRQQEYLKLNKP